LGISQGANGSGVAVVASTVFTGTTLPTPSDITARLNTNGLKSIQVNSELFAFPLFSRDEYILKK
jgi:hypothetical protein